LFTSADEVLNYIKSEGVEMVDVRFCDLPGVMQHFTVPVGSFTEDIFTDGLGFDGSSIRGFQQIHESDMLLLPDPTSAQLDPFRTRKTLILNFFIHDPLTGEAYSRDPRNVAKKAEAYLKGSGIADTVFFGAEAEFHIFDSIQYDSQPQGSFYKIDAESAAWNTGKEEEGGNLGYKPRTKGGYFPVSPTDHYADLRDEIAVRLEAAGMTVERGHHEVGSAGQQEINYRFNTLLQGADDMMLFKYIVKNTANEYGKSATFMPKPIIGDNGSGMHCHQSLWKDGEPLFYDEVGYAGLSTPRATTSAACCTTRRRCWPSPTRRSTATTAWCPASRRRSTWSTASATARPASASRSPATNPKAKRLEFRCPDPSSNPYLAFSAMLMAGLDGIRNKIEPPTPVDKDLYELPPDELADVAQVPASLDAVLDALEADHDFLLEGGVFTEDLISTWIAYKREIEIDAIRLRPHPYEFALYYDI
jgi:glutamine synthetase